ncbi:MAG: elongation factor 4, partial [Elusimicrobia bacterium CG_4_10_14_0_2_um_filter_63_34]
FDAWYDAYRGVIILVKIQQGRLKTGEEIMMMATGKRFTVEELGTFTPREAKGAALLAGEVGYLVANIKELDQTKVGDTI